MTNENRISLKDIQSNEIENYLTTSKHDFKSIMGLVVGASVSAFGAYSLATGYFGNDLTTPKIVSMMIGFLAILIIVDSIKRSAFSKYMNSKIMNISFGYEPNETYKKIVIGVFIFVILFDLIGVYTTASYVQDMRMKSKVVDSLGYKSLESSVDASKINATNYAQAVKLYAENKASAYKNCDDKWHGWKPKYKAQCKEEWDSLNHEPAKETAVAVSSQDIQNIKKNEVNFFDEMLFPLLIILLLALTTIMQYLTVITINDKYQLSIMLLSEDELERIDDIVDDRFELAKEHNRRIDRLRENSEIESYRIKQDMFVATELIKRKEDVRRLAKKKYRANTITKEEYQKIEDEMGKVSTTPVPKIPYSRPAFVASTTVPKNSPTVPGQKKNSRKVKVATKKVEKKIEDKKIIELSNSMIKDVKKGDSIRSRESLRKKGIKFNNANLQDARLYLSQKGKIIKKGNRFYRA